MSESKQPAVCTVDHAGKQRYAIGWSGHRFWLDLARRRRAALERQRRGPPRAQQRD